MKVIRFFFFFQAEDGIRDYKVTGVQTCALPIFAAAEERARDLQAQVEQFRAATQELEELRARLSAEGADAGASPAVDPTLLARIDEAETRAVEARAHAVELQARIAEAETKAAQLEATAADAE